MKLVEFEKVLTIKNVDVVITKKLNKPKKPKKKAVKKAVKRLKK